MNGMKSLNHGSALATFAQHKIRNFGGGYESHYWQREKRYFGSLLGLMVRGQKALLHIFYLSKRKRCTMAKALEEDFWVTQINFDGGISLEHLLQFANLWEMVQGIHLDHNGPDSIRWKLTNDGCYSSKSDYSMQFLGHTKSSMPS
jgi:hypothetical protein